MTSIYEIEDFFNALYDEGDHACFAPTAKGIKVSPIEICSKVEPNFVSLNALEGLKDNNPTKPWHHKNIPRRADCNVTTMRNLLIEIDTGTIKGQWKLVRDSRLPFTTATFSGKKSMHFIISLETPIESKPEYAALHKRICEALDGAPDPACKNPSRLTRFPNASRDGVLQELQYVGERIKNSDLEDWLIEKGCPYVEAKPVYDDSWLNTDVFRLHKLRFSSKKFILNGAEVGYWNRELFKTTCDLLNNNASRESILEILTGITGELDEKDMSTIESALGHAKG